MKLPDKRVADRIRPALAFDPDANESSASVAHRLLFVSHYNWNFARPIVEALSSRPDVELRTLELNNLHDDRIGPPRNVGRATSDEEATQARAALDWADTVFVEWCQANAFWFSRQVGRDTRLVVRLHSSELNVLWPRRMAWENVDAVIFVAPHTRDRAVSELKLDRYPDLRIEVVGNLRNLAPFDRVKHAGADRRLGMIGYQPSLKNPRLAVGILQELHRSDPSWELQFLGHPAALDGRLLTRHEKSRHARESAYYAEFHEAVEPMAGNGKIAFHTWTEDVAEWLRNIGFILSCSDYEGTHEAVIEGMASGAVPVVRRWRGAEGMYPDSLLFSDAEEAAAWIRHVAALEKDAMRDMRDAHKSRARERFDWPSALGPLERVILGTEATPVRTTWPSATGR